MKYIILSLILNAFFFERFPSQLGVVSVRTKLMFNLWNEENTDLNRGLAPNSEVNPELILNLEKEVLSSWFNIASPSFKNSPAIIMPDGTERKMEYDNKYKRLNPMYCKIRSNSSDHPKSEYDFYFRAKGCYVTYSYSLNSNNAGSINIKTIELSKHELNSLSKYEEGLDKGFIISRVCLRLTDFSDTPFRICNADKKVALTWMCTLQKYLNYKKLSDQCYKNSINQVTKLATQANSPDPTVIIETQTPECNTNWNYSQNGKNWECLCSVGSNQSPIELPLPAEAFNLSSKPLFLYKIAEPQNLSDQSILFLYESGMLKLKGAEFGSLIDISNSELIANEINFHTPSEHTIKGKQFDMEMQVIHKSADNAKTSVLSFLFKKCPGKYNKFISNLGFDSLPNPKAPIKQIFDKLYLPYIMQSTDFDDELNVIKNFSFYSYEGSLTTPPCTEETNYYVASEPIELSTTALSLFSEALRNPEYLDNFTGTLVFDRTSKNNREIQAKNDRKVYFQDKNDNETAANLKYSGGDFSADQGHFEHMQIKKPKYIFIEGSEPSNIPGSFLVSELEANQYFQTGKAQ